MRFPVKESTQCLINALTGEVGTSTHFSGNPTNQELAHRVIFQPRYVWR